jgi:glucose/arabinose dehydrogenase
VALHGSWNRSEPDGYKVAALAWRADGSIEESDFLTGFLSDEGIIGRPAFVTEGADGAIYVSDDYAGVVYRVSTVP